MCDGLQFTASDDVGQKKNGEKASPGAPYDRASPVNREP